MRVAYACASMHWGEHRNLVLILAREFAMKLATPMFITDAAGTLVFYNEPAEVILGRPYSEAGELSAAQWAELFRCEDLEGRPLSLERMPAGITFYEQRPAHGCLRIVGLDGARREIAVTAFPLFARQDEFVGIVAVFWEQPT
jgi:PAS domain-containing protein